MADVMLSQKQAREFARLIYTDVHSFCMEHKEEFEAFLKADQEGENYNEAAKD